MSSRFRWMCSLAALVGCSLVSPALAEVRLSGLFTDHLILQRGMPVPIWGTGDNGEMVTVSFAGHEAKATIEGGRWQVTLPELEASAESRELSVKGTNLITIKDVVVGEVWLASGQSNMQWPVNRSADPEQTIAAANHPLLRLYTVPRQAADEPQADVMSHWEICSPESVPEFSAVGYAFGLHLHDALKVPVGIISTNYGGTPAEAWTSKEELGANEALSYMLTNPPAMGVQRPYGLYNAMIHPLIPAAFRGAIWYQGESNAPRAYEYRTLFPVMINCWRKAFARGDFPFLFVQLAPFMKIEPEPGDSAWAELREAQLYTSQTVPNTAQAVITDLGDEVDIHPKAKAPVGNRLGMAARALAYGEPIIYRGPVYKSVEFKGADAILSFDSVGAGLVAKDGPLTGFAVAGADQKFHKAEARIDGDKVIVTCAQVAEPMAVRYGWANFPVVNLWNQDGLPASPFRTDDFPLTTKPK
ncbi:MAG: sialate O-acetylesterase [Pirellulales bacterium]|nr:sialate O-acetylesterase [Pirellulales bacterium]